MTTKISSDYLIVGTGAVGMAFADVLLSETDATITMVDRYPAPGGHWNVAYPFVTLHQPSAFYGVSSKELKHSKSFKSETLWKVLLKTSPSMERLSTWVV